MIADAFGATGRPEEGLRCLEEATDLVDKAGKHYAASSVYRVHGELLVSVGDLDEGLARLMQALAIARRQGGCVLELRAAVSLARHWRARGDPAMARELLRPLLSRQIDGLDAPAFRDAKTLTGETSG